MKRYPQRNGRSVNCWIRERAVSYTHLMPPAKFPMVTRELFQAYIDMEEEMVARAEVGALAREEQQAALEMGL